MKSSRLLLLVLGLFGPAAASAQMTYYGKLYISSSGADAYSYAVVPFGWVHSNMLILRQNGSEVDSASGRSYYGGQSVYLSVGAYTNPPAYTLFEMQGEAYGELPDYGWFWQPLYESGVTPPPSVSVNGFTDAWDGESGQFSISVDGGTATAWQWGYSAPAGSGNNPHVTFYSPYNSSTATNSHWFALPDAECAGSPSQYQITGYADIQSGWYSGSTPFQVHVPVNGGETFSPEVDGTVMLMQPSVPGGLWTVGQNNYYRTLPVIRINVLAPSQFWNKISIHENIHYNQYTTGMFAQYWSPTVAYNRVKNFTDSTKASLDARVSAEVDAYNAEQDVLVNAQMPNAEVQAYAVSDTVAPLFFYQYKCGRH